MTPDFDRLISAGKVDVRCRACGEGSAYTSRCYACGSEDLDIIPHGSPGWTHCLGGGGGAVERQGTPRPRRSVTAANKPPVQVAEPYPGTLGL